MAYAATKGAIQNFTAGLAQLLAEKGIRVNAVVPGPIWTPLIPSTMPVDAVAEFRQERADEAARAARRACNGLRHGRRSDVQPCFRRHYCSDRRKAAPIGTTFLRGSHRSSRRDRGLRG